MHKYLKRENYKKYGDSSKIFIPKKSNVEAQVT